jgi:hypothetical protein
MLLLLGDESYNFQNFEVETYVDTLTTEISYEQIERIDNFVTMLKDSLSIDTLAEKFDVMYLLANETSEIALRNLVKTTHRATAVNSPTFTAYEGFTGDGISSYLNTNYNPSTQKVNYTQNSASMGLYSLKDVYSAAYRDVQTYTATVGLEMVFGVTSAGIYFMKLNNATSIVDTFGVSNGFLVLSRTASNLLSTYHNGLAGNVSTEASGTIPSLNIVLGARNEAGSISNYSARTYSFFFIASGLSSEEVTKITNIFEWYLNELGLLVSSNIFDVDQLNNGTQVAEGLNTPFSSFKFQTNSDFIEITANPTLYTYLPSWSYLKLYKDGAHFSYQKIINTDRVRIEIGDGIKTIEITEDGEKKVGSNIYGTFLTGVYPKTGSNNTTITSPADERLIFIGNSIATGGNATQSQMAFPILFRDSSNYVNVYGWGSGGAWDMFPDSATAQTTVNWIDSLADGTDSNKVIICLGTNDYGLNKMDSADFADDYAFFLYLLNKERSDIKIYAVTPLVRTTETANTFSNTLDDYREAITTASSGKAYVTVINGKTILTTGDLDDNVHPTTAGHIKIYNALKDLIL